jgi:hypothetical protein
MSDTHSMTPHIKFDVPQGDIFLHAGDFTRCGRQEEVTEFNEWIGKIIRLLMYSYIVDIFRFLLPSNKRDWLDE